MGFEYKALYFAELLLRISCLLLSGAKESSQPQPEVAQPAGLSSCCQGHSLSVSPLSPFSTSLGGNLSYQRKWLYPGLDEHRA